MIDPARIFVWVHTWHGRSASDRGKTLRSLDQSDAAGRYEVLCQPATKHRDDFYLAVLSRVCDDTRYDYMLRLEDDVVVNKSLLHNACNWKALSHPLFGAGWLSVTSGLLEDRVNCAQVDGFMTRQYPECHFAGGVIVSTKMLRSCMDVLEKRLRAGGGSFAPGCALSRGVWSQGKRVFFHEPSLVMIDMSIPAYHTGRPGQEDFVRQPFDPNWRA